MGDAIQGMGEVTLAEYDPDWPAQFESLRRTIARAIPDARIEHIGSTSVPGCAAKPVIDISIGLAPGTSVRDATLTAAGLKFRSVRPYSVVFAVDRADGTRHANAHVRYRDSEAEIGDLRFRDFLRTHPDAVRDYVNAKRRAASIPVGNDGYTRAKAPFIEELQVQIKRWAKASGWKPG